MKPKYRAIIFDFDGTLVDTLADLANAMNYALRKNHCAEHQKVAYKKFVGDGAPTLVRRALPPDKVDLLPLVLADFSAYYQKHWADETSVYAGIMPLLTTLKQDGYGLNILSNKPHRYVPPMVHQFFPADLFTAVYGQQETCKPDPRGALAIAQEINMAPAEILYVGDSATDMQTATNAHMTACGVLWGFRDETELRDNGADFIVAQPAEIITIINQ